MQQQSADTHPFFDIDKAYYELERKTIHGRGTAKEKALQRICKVVDEGFQVLEEIFRTLKEEGPIYEPFTGDLAGAPKGGDMQADWPMRSESLPRLSSISIPMLFCRGMLSLKTAVQGR